MADGSKVMAERITHGLIPAHCSLRDYQRNGEMWSYKMGPSLRKAGLGPDGRAWKFADGAGRR